MTHEPNAPGPDDQPQLDLLNGFVTGELTRKLRTLAPEVMADFDADAEDVFSLSGSAPARRGAGRPKGSPNKTTKDFREYVIARFGHPLAGAAMFGIWRSFEELVFKAKALSNALGISPEKALDFMGTCNARISPYIEGQMPIRVDAKVAGGVTIAIGADMFGVTIDANSTGAPL